MAEGNVSFNINLQLQNKSNQVLREVTIPLLAANPGPVNASQNSQNIQANTILDSGEIKLNLIPLLPNQSADLNINYSSAKLARETAGTYALYIPSIRQTESLAANTKWVVDVANDLPPLLYTSKPELNNYGRHLEWQGNEKIFLIFAERNSGVSINQSLAADSNELTTAGEYLVNLPYQSEGGKLVFNSLPSAGAYQAASTHNIFLRLPDNAQLAFSMSRFWEDKLVAKNDFKYIDHPGLTWEYNDNEDTLTQAYKAVIDRLIPASTSATITRDTLKSTGRSFVEQSQTASSIQYAYLLSEYLLAADIPARVMYGYAIGFDSHPEHNISGPQAWVEVWQGERSFLYSPYLEDLLGVSAREIPQNLLVPMGMLNIDATYDTALGLLGDSTQFVPRPQFNKAINPTLASAITPDQLEITVTAPNNLPLGWSSYRPTLTITNASNRILTIQSVKIDLLENIRSLVVANDLYPAVLPAQSTTLQPIVWVPSVFGGGSQHLVQVLAVTEEGLELNKDSSYILTVGTNIPLLGVLALTAVLLIAGWVIFMRRSLYLKAR